MLKVVVSNSTYLGCELCAALLLEVGQDRALVLLAAALVVQQPPRQLLAVELSKQVLRSCFRQGAGGREEESRQCIRGAMICGGGRGRTQQTGPAGGGKQYETIVTRQCSCEAVDCQN